MELKSALFDCRVTHQRLTPIGHRLDYRLFYFYLDLYEIDAIADRFPFISRNRFNLYSFYDADHLPLSAQPLREKVTRVLEEHGFNFELGRVMLLTQMRVMGYGFNPVSFFFCFDRAEQPRCVIAEVENTYHERKAYCIRADANSMFQNTEKKYFYVSPFIRAYTDFNFYLSVPNEQLRLRIDSSEQGKKILLATLSGKKIPLTALHVLQMTLLYPLIPLKIMLMIQWNAFLLWAKKISYHKKKEQIDLQRKFWPPHS